MVSASQIREVAQRYIDQRDDKIFALEFSKLSFNVRQHGSPEAVRLVREIESRLASLSVGHLSRHALLAELQDIARPRAVGYYFAAGASLSFNSVNQPAVVEKAFPVAASSGTLPGVVFGLTCLPQG